MNQATLLCEGSILKLGGAVNSSTAADLYRKLTDSFGALSGSAVKGQVIILDCSGIDSCDSSAVALLLAANRMAVAQGLALTVAGLTSQVESLAHLYGAGELLDLPAAI